MNTFLALWQTPVQAWGVFDWLKLIIILAAGVGIVYVALRVFGVTIPGWAVQIFWIVVCAFVAILALNLIASL